LWNVYDVIVNETDLLNIPAPPAGEIRNVENAEQHETSCVAVGSELTPPVAAEEKTGRVVRARPQGTKAARARHSAKDGVDNENVNSISLMMKGTSDAMESRVVLDRERFEYDRRRDERKDFSSDIAAYHALYSSDTLGAPRCSRSS
jgi:hypothetical protein